MSWFNGVTRYTKLTEREKQVLDILAAWSKEELPKHGERFKLKGPANLKGYFAKTSWGIINSFADLRPDTPEIVKLKYSNYRFAFPSRINTCYQVMLSICQRTLKAAFPELQGKQMAISMSQYTWAEPEDMVPEHVDSEIGYKLSYRIHLPVTGVSTVRLRRNNYTMHTRPGISYALNNRIPHAYANECGELNAFFTVDFIEADKLFTFPEAAFWTKSFPEEADEPGQVDFLEVEV